MTNLTLHTSKGDITLQLDAEKAPITVANFINYFEKGHFNGTIFHRVIKNFMIQGGGMDADMKQLPTQESIENEANNGLKNNKGTIAMARTMEPHSASSQFFINLSDNDFLNHSGENMQGWGYCVFGEVTAGLDVVEAIGEVATTSKNGHQDVPQETISIDSITLND